MEEVPLAEIRTWARSHPLCLMSSRSSICSTFGYGQNRSRARRRVSGCGKGDERLKDLILAREPQPPPA